MTIFHWYFQPFSSWWTISLLSVEAGNVQKVLEKMDFRVDAFSDSLMPHHREIPVIKWSNFFFILVKLKIFCRFYINFCKSNSLTRPQAVVPNVFEAKNCLLPRCAGNPARNIRPLKKAFLTVFLRIKVINKNFLDTKCKFF